MTRTQISISLSREATTWYSKLAPERRTLVDARLQELALDPEGAPFNEPGPAGSPRYIARIDIDDGEVLAYRVVYIVDRTMQPHLPAIVVLRARALPYHR